MKKELIDLKKAVHETAATHSMEIYELLIMLEGTDAYDEFGRQHGSTALEIFKGLFYSGVDFRLNFLSVVSRSRNCNCDVEEIGFWEDMGIIISLYESLEDGGYYAEKTA